MSCQLWPCKGASNLLTYPSFGRWLFLRLRITVFSHEAAPECKGFGVNWPQMWTKKRGERRTDWELRITDAPCMYILGG